MVARNDDDNEAGLSDDDVVMAFENTEAVAVSEGPLDHVKDIQAFLVEAGIPALVTGCEERGGACGPSRLRVAVPLDRAEEAAALLEERWRDDVTREGLSADANGGGIVDLSADEVTCPACGHVGRLRNGACEECELSLA